jgi:hypothetical protein
VLIAFAVAILTSRRRAWRALVAAVLAPATEPLDDRASTCNRRSGLNGGLTAGSGCLRPLEPGELSRVRQRSGRQLTPVRSRAVP